MHSTKAKIEKEYTFRQNTMVTEGGKRKRHLSKENANLLEPTIMLVHNARLRELLGKQYINVEDIPHKVLLEYLLESGGGEQVLTFDVIVQPIRGGTFVMTMDCSVHKTVADLKKAIEQQEGTTRELQKIYLLNYNDVSEGQLHAATRMPMEDTDLLPHDGCKVLLAVQPRKCAMSQAQLDQTDQIKQEQSVKATSKRMSPATQRRLYRRIKRARSMGRKEKRKHLRPGQASAPALAAAAGNGGEKKKMGHARNTGQWGPVRSLKQLLMGISIFAY